MVLQRDYNGRVEAEVTSLADSSIISQLTELKRKHAELTVAAAADFVKVVRFSSTDEQCLRITKLAEEFEGLELGVLLPDRTVIHGTEYELWLQSQFGSRLWLSVAGGGAETPLLKWAEKARQVLVGECPQREDRNSTVPAKGPSVGVDSHTTLNNP